MGRSRNDRVMVVALGSERERRCMALVTGKRGNFQR